MTGVLKNNIIENLQWLGNHGTNIYRIKNCFRQHQQKSKKSYYKMNKGKFIWADLSTYNPTDSMNFYSSVFGWKMKDVESYYIAQLDDANIAGIYETPPFFKKIKMPHFWMSYFQVESITDTIKSAEANGGKVELKDVQFNNGNIALIRDPLGAGFTVYDGKELYLESGHNHSIIATELHVSNADKVLKFYTAIFDWNYKEIETNVFQVASNKGIGDIIIRETPNTIKGKFEYWVTTISVKDVKEITDKIIANGGEVISIEKGRTLVCDNTKESFLYIKQNQ